MSDIRVRYHASKTGLSPQQFSYTVPVRCLYCNSLCASLVSYMAFAWSLFVPISPVGASGEMRFVIVASLAYIHIYVFLKVVGLYDTALNFVS